MTGLIIKVEEGIRENEFLGIVLSQEALKSEWVKAELSAAWIKQMQKKKLLFSQSCIAIVIFHCFLLIANMLILEVNINQALRN